MFEYCSEATAERAIATVVSVEPVQGNTHPNPTHPFESVCVACCTFARLRCVATVRSACCGAQFKCVSQMSDRCVRSAASFLIWSSLSNPPVSLSGAQSTPLHVLPLDAAAGSVCRAVRHCAIRQRALAASRGHYLPGAVHRRHRSQLQCRHVRYVSKG